MATTPQVMTLEEFLRLPEEKPALEYVAGAVRQKVSPGFVHGLLQGILFQWINQFAWTRKLATAVVELRTVFAGAAHVPDVAVCTWWRVPRDAQGWAAARAAIGSH